MSNRLDSIEETRETAAQIVAELLSGIDRISEADFSERLKRKIAEHPELYPDGWYDPPPSGIAALWATAPFTRLQFSSLRDKPYWPSDTRFTEESVGMVYCSPVKKETGLLGDFGCTLYRGSDERVRAHIRNSFEAIYAIAEQASIGMKFSELFSIAGKIFKERGVRIGWMRTDHDQLQVNLGHTVPGSYGEVSPADESFSAARERIRTGRLYINTAETFQIPETCAFTVEARLTDESGTLPNAFFHLIVLFQDGEKRILTNFDTIFRISGMSAFMSHA